MAIPQWVSFEHLEQEHPGVLSDIDKFDDFISDIYAQARNMSREEYRTKYSDWLVKMFLAAKGRDRRANQHDPKIIFVNLLIKRHKEAQERGDL